MDQINTIMRTQLSEREVMIYLLVEHSTLSQRKIGLALGISYDSVRQTYEKAKAKMDKFADQGLFTTPVKKV